jgi:hypothetical protein
MNLSMKIAWDESKEGNKDLGDIGFILTVLRDNTTDDYVYKVLDNLIKGGNGAIG